MTDVHLDATDAMELAELLLFVRNWIWPTFRDRLGPGVSRGQVIAPS